MRASPIALAMTGLFAAGAAAEPTRLRHEYVPPTFFDGFDAGRGGETALEGGDPMPTAVRRDGERLPAPGEADPSEPTFGSTAPTAPDGGILRPDRAEPDRDTQADRRLTYHAVFNPSVAPLRRNVAFDAVGADYGLTIAPGPHTPVPLAPREALPGREVFWGDIKLDSVPRRPMPIPSVAPDMRVMALQAEPPVNVEVLRDGADNFYVRSRHRGPLRLVLLVDADATYFWGDVPGNVPLDVLQGEPATALPETAQAYGRQVLTALGVDPQGAYRAQLDRLVEHFRGFQAGPPPDARGDIYLDLALGGVGVCRHRAFAFVVTARAAGVPARYVQNEAHAFVEILGPDRRWRRIDLGGEAPQLDIKGGETRRLHTPPPDPFPKPQSFLDGYSSLLARGELGGGADAPGPVSGAPTRIGVSGDVVPPGAPVTPRPGPPPEVPLPPPAPLDPPIDLPASPESTSGGGARPVAVAIEAPDGIAYRGEPLPFPVAGRLGDAHPDAAPDAPVGGVRVQIYLVPVGRTEGFPVGRPMVTDADGRFQTELRLPQTLPLGRYRIVAASAAERGFAPGRSR